MQELEPTPNAGGSRPFSNADIGYFEATPEGLVVRWSRLIATLTGLAPEEAIGRPWTMALHPDEHHNAAREWQHRAEAGASFCRLCTFLHRNGATRRVWCEAEPGAGNRIAIVTPASDEFAMADSVSSMGVEDTERSLAQQQIDYLTERLALAVKGAGFGVWEHDIAAGRLLWDERMLEIHGYTPATFDGTKRSWLAVLHPDDAANVLAYSARLFSGEESGNFIFRILRANDGEVRWIESNGRLQRDSQGRPVRVVGMNRDVTATKFSETQLTLLQTCVSRINDILLITNAKGPEGIGPQIVYVNDAFERRTGYRRDEVIGRSPQLLCGPLTDLKEIARMDQAIAAVVPVRADLINYTRTGEQFWVEIEMLPVLDGFGTCTHWVAVQRDVTERKKAEEVLRRTRELLEMTQAIGGIGGWELDVASQQIFWTAGTYRICEVDPSEPVPTPEEAMEFHPPEYRQLLAESMERALQGGAPLDLEVELITRKGRRIWVHISSKVTFIDGKAAKLTGSVHDITNRKLAEEALRESKERLEALFANALNGIMLARDDGSYVDANPSICAMLGYSRDELLSMGVADVVLTGPPSTTALELFAGFLDEGRSRGLVRLRCKDGSVITAEYSAVSNVVPGLHLSILSDVTEWLNAQEALRRNEERYALTLAAVNDGVWDWDLETGTVYFSPQWYMMLGYTPSEFPATFEEWANRLHPDDLERATQSVRESVEKGGDIDLDFRMKARNGTWRWIHSRARTVEKNPDGKAKRFVGTHTDISESRALSEKLTESYSMMAALAEQVPGVLYRYRAFPDGRMTLPYSSRGMEEMFEFTPEELRDDASLTFSRTHPDDLEDLFESIRRSAETLEPWRHEYRVILPRQGLKWRRGDARPTRLEDGSVLWHGFITDVTERRRSDAEREALQAKLLQAQKLESIGQLAGGVAHDFNNMLTVILSHTEIAMGHADPASPIMKDLTAIHDSATRSADLTRQLLAYARKQSTSPEVLDPNEAITKTLDLLKRLIGERIQLSWAPTADLWPVRMDRSHLDQIITNLVVNARDAIVGVGGIAVEARNVELEESECAAIADATTGKYIHISVRDTGRGMSREIVERIFEPFFTTKGVGEGTGLGLATVYGTVKQNGGFIEVISAPGLGSAFDIYLPRHEGVVAAQPRPAKVADSELRGTETVLVVEDEPQLLELNVTILERAGYRVLAAPGPEEALALVADFDGRIDLLLTDMVMPAMNGRQLCELLAPKLPGLRVICVSGYTADEFGQGEAGLAGAHFLQKPFSVDKLRRTVRQVLDE